MARDEERQRDATQQRRAIVLDAIAKGDSWELVARALAEAGLAAISEESFTRLSKESGGLIRAAWRRGRLRMWVERPPEELRRLVDAE